MKRQSDLIVSISKRKSLRNDHRMVTLLVLVDPMSLFSAVVAEWFAIIFT